MPKVLKILGSRIAIVDIVGMFPYITSKEWRIFSSEWSCSIGCRYDIEWSITLSNEPCPTRSKCCECNLVEFCLKRLNSSPFFDNSLSHSIWYRRWSGWCEWIKIKCMIPYLSSIIEYTPSRMFDDIFERLILKFCSDNQFIEVIYIGLMMFASMKLKSLSWDIWYKCIICIWKRWTSEHSIYCLGVVSIFSDRESAKLYYYDFLFLLLYCSTDTIITKILQNIWQSYGIIYDIRHREMQVGVALLLLTQEEIIPFHDTQTFGDVNENNSGCKRRHLPDGSSFRGTGGQRPSFRWWKSSG